MKCCVIGLGYIGLPTSVILAQNGHNVLGVDINPDIINKLNNGSIHIKENGLQESFLKVLSNSKFKAQLTLVTADVYIITVPTPFIAKECTHIPTPEIKFVVEASNAISKVIKKGNLVLLESTSPVGTTEHIADLISTKSGLSIDEFNIAYCPERVLPGNILYELVNNDRVIGGVNKKASESAFSFYKTFCKGNLLKTNSKTAELVKLSENAYRDVNIAFANELSIISNQFNIDSSELIKLANHHPRVNILRPGCGVGGHCIAVDPWFIAYKSPDSSELIQAARRVNDNKRKWVTEQILLEVSKLKKELNRPPVVGCFGLTFKPNIDDTRESPALFITQELISQGLNVFVCEPNLDSYPKLVLEVADNVVTESDILVFLVSHQTFEKINTQNRVVLDYCGLFS